MTLSVNDKTLEIEEGKSLDELLTELNYSDSTGIAVAVNQEITPKPEWPKVKLQDKDNILIITATQGG
ncbi:MAG: sulfur carrier protein ThiS [Bacteroidetes bacterium]|nr:sulfur carrier protein ThiS [Bacteroidota bacterium]